MEGNIVEYNFTPDSHGSFTGLAAEFLIGEGVCLLDGTFGYV